MLSRSTERAHSGQYQSPLGTRGKAGCRQCRWYTLGHDSQHRSVPASLQWGEGEGG